MKSPLAAKTKQKMQDVDFKTVDDFLNFLPTEELEIVELLRKTVYDCIPNVTEKLAYNVPFFKKYTTICFIWPASVLWGKKKTYEGVRFGFTSGHLMLDEINYLEKGSRKNVYWKDFTSVNEIDTDLLKTYIYDAVLIDQEKAIIKKTKKNNFS